MGRIPAPRLASSAFDVVAGPTKPIVGIVRLKGTGEPVAGVRVTSAEGTSRAPVGDTTDAEGRFRLVGLPKGGSYRVRAWPLHGDPYLGAEVTVTDTEGLKPIEVTLDLHPGVPVTGRLVETATGKPVRAMRVSHSKLPTNRHEGYAQTAARISPIDKTFLITVPPGEGMIYANAPGLDSPFIRARLKEVDKGKGVGGDGDNETITISLMGYHTYKFIDVPADAVRFSVELELTRGVSRKGKLIGPDGRPVVGARSYGLVARWGGVQTLKTDNFEVVGLEPGHPRRVFFAHQGRKLVGSIVVNDEDLKAITPLEVKLVPAGSIVGRLVDDDGLSMAGTTLSVVSYDLEGINLPYGGDDALWPGNETFTTDAEGRFRVEGFVPDVESIIEIESRIHPHVRLDAGKALQKLTTGPGEVRDLGDVKVKVQPVE